PYLKTLKIVAPRTIESEGHSFRDSIRPRAKAPPGAIERVLRGCQLRQLDLDGWTLTDSACSAISRQSQLEDLWIFNGSFSEDAFVRILQAPGLRSLHL